MNSTSGSRKSVADDEFKRRAMDAYQAKGKSATMNAASSMKARSASTRHAMRDRSDSESSLSSESEMSDSDSDASGASPRGRGRRRRGRHRDDSLSSESDGEDKRQGFSDDAYGTEGAKLAKQKRHRSGLMKFLDKLCPGCCAVTAGKYAVGENKADQQAKLYEGVNNTLEPVLRLLAIFTIGVPQTESAIPMAHWLPLVLSSLLCLGGSLLYASDWSTDYPLNSLSFLALFLLQFVFLWQGSRYFRKREMSTLCQELEGRSWNWTRQLPVLLKQVNLHSGLFLAILTLGYAATLCGYFIISDLEAVDGMMVFYVSRVLFGFYMNGVVFCMPILFSLEASLVSARVQSFTEQIGKFPNLDSAIEEHIEIWKCIDRLSKLWSSSITASVICTAVCAMANIHYLTNRESYYFLQNMIVPAVAMLMMLTSAAKITSRCRYTAIHLSGYRSSADIFLAPLERIDFLTYLHANDGGFRVAGVVVSSQGVQKLAGLYVMLLVYLFTLQMASSNVPTVATSVVGLNG